MSEEKVTAPTKTKVEKAHSYLALISTTIGILGAGGTIFVWAATTFFLGDIQIIPDQPVDSLQVKVIDHKGQAAVYFGKDIQLLPGHYHLQIGLPDQPPIKHADVDVKLWKISTVPLAVSQAAAAGVGNAASASAAQQDNGEAAHRHWWQFWKKRQ